MGATVVMRKAVAAFESNKGDVVYVLFEESYEKNCYPHTPSWDVLFIGKIESVLRRIFSSASACEGGSLQGKSGHITPEGYIRGWFSALANPVAFSLDEITLSVGDKFYSPIPTGSSLEAFQKLENLGLSEYAQRLKEGDEVKLNLRNQTEAVLALFGDFIQAWRVLPGYLLENCRQPAPSLGFNPQVKKKSLTHPAGFVRLGEYILMPSVDSHGYKVLHAEYVIIQEFVRDAWRHELTSPGSYWGNIKEFREFLKNIPRVATDWIAVVDLGYRLHDFWVLGRIDGLKKRIVDQSIPSIETEKEICVPVLDIEKHGLVWDFANIPSENVTWFPSVPILRQEESPDEEIGSVDGCENQLDMFA